MCEIEQGIEILRKEKHDKNERIKYLFTTKHNYIKELVKKKPKSSQKKKKNLKEYKLLFI